MNTSLISVLCSQPINLNATSGQPGARRRLLSTLEVAIGAPRHRSRKLLQNLDLFQDFTEVGTQEGLEDDYDANGTNSKLQHVVSMDEVSKRYMCIWNYDGALP